MPAKLTIVHSDNARFNLGSKTYVDSGCSRLHAADAKMVRSRDCKVSAASAHNATPVVTQGSRFQGMVFKSCDGAPDETHPVDQEAVGRNK